MKAAVMRENSAPLELEEVGIDAPAAGEVLVKTAANGDTLCIVGFWACCLKMSLPRPKPIKESRNLSTIPKEQDPQNKGIPGE